MMAGHGLVQGERAHSELGHLVHVAQGWRRRRRARAVECGREVIRARRVFLLELGDTPHFDRRLGSEPDHPARADQLILDHPGVVSERCLATIVGVRVEETRVLGKPREGLGRCLTGPQLCLRRENRHHLRIDARHLRQPEVVHFLRRHARGGLAAQAIGVVRIAVGQLPDAVIGGGPRQLTLEECDQLVVGRHHTALDHLSTARLQGVLVGCREFGQLSTLLAKFLYSGLSTAGLPAKARISVSTRSITKRGGTTPSARAARAPPVPGRTCGPPDRVVRGSPRRHDGRRYDAD
jgi:hypothetical protein